VLDTGESSNLFNVLVPGLRREDVWILARVPFRVFAGMTILKLFSPIATQSRMPGNPEKYELNKTFPDDLCK
jgi:hypothetical protein